MKDELNRREILKWLGSTSLLLASGCSSQDKKDEKNIVTGTSPTAIYFDRYSSMHDLPGHPESAKRLELILDQLREKNLLSYLSFRPSARFSLGHLKKFHSEDMIDKIRKQTDGYYGKEKWDAYATKYAMEISLRAMGGLLQICEDVVSGWVQNGFALNRPPGHNCTPNKSMGYGLFNYVAVVANYLLASKQVKRIAIIDTDAQHGNGTQEFFHNKSNVLYASFHQKSLWPYTGKATEAGKSNTTINAPLPRRAGGVAYRTIFDEIIAPKVKTFKPNIILVSAGYNSHWKDPMSDLSMSLMDLVAIDQSIVRLAQETCRGKVVYNLEGGYHPEVLPEGVLNTFLALTGQVKFSDKFGAPPHREPSVEALVQKLREVHKI